MNQNRYSAFVFLNCCIIFAVSGWLRAVELDSDLTKSYPQMQPGEENKNKDNQKPYTQVPQYEQPKKVEFPKKDFVKNEKFTRGEKEPFKGVNEQYPLGNLYQNRTLSFETKKYDMHRYSGEKSQLDNLETVRETMMAVKYSEARHYDTPMSKLNEIYGITEQISMRDINRFQFRRNRSDTPGLNIQKAGESLHTNSGESNLKSIPKETTSTRQPEKQ